MSMSFFLFHSVSLLFTLFSLLSFSLALFLIYRDREKYTKKGEASVVFICPTVRKGRCNKKRNLSFVMCLL